MQLKFCCLLFELIIIILFLFRNSIRYVLSNYLRTHLVKIALFVFTAVEHLLVL